MKQRIRSLLLLSAWILAVAACHAPEPTSPSAELTNGAAPRPPDLGHGPPRVAMTSGYNVFLGEEVTKICAGTAPFFAFDSSAQRPTDEPSMQVLADCMLTGALKGKSIKLVGRTDPRGSESYNQRLGLERAERIKGYLIERGVEAQRIATASAGEVDASREPKNWPKDRRVEIQLTP